MNSIYIETLFNATHDYTVLLCRSDNITMIDTHVIDSGHTLALLYVSVERFRPFAKDPANKVEWFRNATPDYIVAKNGGRNEFP